MLPSWSINMASAPIGDGFKDYAFSNDSSSLAAPRPKACTLSTLI